MSIGLTIIIIENVLISIWTNESCKSENHSQFPKKVPGWPDSEQVGGSKQTGLVVVVGLTVTAVQHSSEAAGEESAVGLVVGRHELHNCTVKVSRPGRGKNSASCHKFSWPSSCGLRFLQSNLLGFTIVTIVADIFKTVIYYLCVKFSTWSTL